MRQLIRWPALKEIVPFSRQHVLCLEKEGGFSKRVRLGDNSVAWFADEVETWHKERASARDIEPTQEISNEPTRVAPHRPALKLWILVMRSRSDRWADDALEAALAYASAGWPLVPCERNTKLPLIKSWQHKATCSTAQIRSWNQRWPRGVNIAVATGPQSGTPVVDADIRADVDGIETLKKFQAEGLVLPPTPAQRTGSGGLQLVFAYPRTGESIPNSAGRLGQGLDVRAAGGLADAATINSSMWPPLPLA